MNSITTAIVLDTRYQKKDGTYPIKIRVTCERVQKYYTLGESMTKEEYERACSGKPRGEAKAAQILFFQEEERARSIIDGLAPFSFPEFKKRWKRRKSPVENVFYWYDERIATARAEGRIGTAQTYTDSKESIAHFNGGRELYFSDVTASWLKSYETWMTNRGRTPTTVSIYLRVLRMIFNLARDEGIIPQRAYPFGKRRYQIPRHRNPKKALRLKDVERIFKYKTEDERVAWARDIWVLSYLLNGMNIADLARLRHSDIEKNEVTFYRKKTENQKRAGRPIIAFITPEARAIFGRWGQPPAPSRFVFDWISPRMTPRKKKERTKWIIAKLNKFLKVIAQDLELGRELKTSSARHSFATILKQSGAPIEYISEALGHSDIKVTENYLDSFETDTRRKFAERLTDFDKK